MLEYIAAALLLATFLYTVCKCCENFCCTAFAGWDGDSGDNPFAASFEVVVTGFADDNCSDCEVWNGTWELDFDSATANDKFFEISPIDGANWCGSGELPEIRLQFTCLGTPTDKVQLTVTFVTVGNAQSALAASIRVDRDTFDCNNIDGIVINEGNAFSWSTPFGDPCDVSAVEITISQV